MTKENFMEAVKELEASYRTPWKKDAEYVEERSHRRAAIFKAVRDFSDEVVREAFDRLGEEAEGFPTRHEILDACREVEARSTLRTENGRRRFEPARHTCKPVQLLHSGALRLLRGLSPYEAAHVACGAEIQVTCPKCGVLHGPVENPLVAGLMRDFPEETTDWSSNFKGTLVCPQCARPEGRR